MYFLKWFKEGLKQMWTQGLDLCIFQSTFHKDDQYQISLHLVDLFLWKQKVLSIMLYKVYVNLCDPRTRTAQSYYISTCHWDDPCQISLHLVYLFMRRFKKISHIWPLSGVGPFMTPGTLFAQTWISLSQGCFIPNIN